MFITWALVFTLMPPKVKQLAAMIGQARNGGRSSTRAQLVNMDGAVIPGLYAAGEVVGLYYRNYPGSTSVMRGAEPGNVSRHDLVE